ncbi:MAG: tRNA pseudouridine(38-40) synthase TruA [Spirochaeta sp.]|nr:tRNA pseudouridine(38-40) synthase TruA [Spirochaeta sp.]
MKRPATTSPEEQRLKLTIAYNGARFKGWQKGNGRTVQDALIAALERALPESPGIRVDGAGRTDAGVHAEGQVASVVVPRGVDRVRLLHLVNRYLPDDVAVRSVERADDRFHARYHAVARTYRYTVVDGPVGNPFLHGLAWRHPGDLDLPAMETAARVFIGEHDFAAFTADKKRANTVRSVISIDISRRESSSPQSEHRPVDIHICGTSFLWRQVRVMVGALVLSGEGALTADTLHAILASGDRSRAPAPAPAWGLTLTSVEYPDGTH